MSLIIDATNAAQREKERRAASSAGVPPMLVPLRSQPAREFSWQRALMIGIGGAVLLGAGWVVFVKMQDVRRQPMALVSPPLISDVAAGLPVVDSSAPVHRDVASRPAQTTPSPRAATAPVRPAPAPAAVAPSNPPESPRVAVGPARDSAAALPQGDVQAQPVRQAETPGRLNIAVDPREASLSQIFAAGVAAHRNGDLFTARGAYERVLAADPNHVDALNNMGVLLSSTRELDRAELVLRKAVRLSPRNAGAWNNLGTALAQRGQPNDAIAAFQHALDIDPLHPSARVSLAQQYLAVGALKESRALLEAVLASDASVAEAHYALGQVLELERDWAGAIRSYNAFVRTAPGRLAGHVEHVRRRVEALSERVR